MTNFKVCHLAKYTILGVFKIRNAFKSLRNVPAMWVSLPASCLAALSCVVQAGLLTPLTFNPASLKSLGCFFVGLFTSCVYFVHNGRRWYWIREVYSINFKGIFEDMSQSVSGMLDCFSVSIIHRTRTWTAGSRTYLWSFYMRNGHPGLYLQSHPKDFCGGRTKFDSSWGRSKA